MARSGYFNSVEELYKNRLNNLIRLADRFIYNKDYSIDAVHDAMAKSIEYFNKHPEKKVQAEIVEWLVIKACKKHNRFSQEITHGHPGSNKDEKVWIY